MTYDANNVHAQAAEVASDIADRAVSGGEGGESLESEDSQAENISNGGRPDLESPRVDVPEGEGRTDSFQGGFIAARPQGAPLPSDNFFGQRTPKSLPGDGDV